ncbi:RDD family protein [Kaistella sp. G5-32]|uniref:RDD family protein n=1 Tax=Kaistella gelatinilytica TaxID=2787636 RepID=A0ABS0FEE1_9FLAO|nr:RDD family protein [Kaistella gelatinilytica]MBF8458075.1 RDD family protein [Kaistella gelatinilytica]
MSLIAINTSQNVNINFNTASVGERILAFGIDMLIKGAYLLVTYLIFFRVFNLGAFFNTLDNWSVMAVIIIITLPIHIYTLVCESLLEGQTFGKKVVRIKVVKIDGFQAGFGDYLIRWFFRLVDVFSNSGVVGLITMIVSKNNQRLGGIASGTAVISLKNHVTISHTILENLKEDYLPVFPQVIALTDNDVRIIKENYQKALKSDDRQILSKLSSKIKEILKLDIDPTKFTERRFIDIIIKDYNFYTGKDI